MQPIIVNIDHQYQCITQLSTVGNGENNLMRAGSGFILILIVNIMAKRVQCMASTDGSRWRTTETAGQEGVGDGNVDHA
jgi:hypothetical protein